MVSIAIYKSKRILELTDGSSCRSFKIALGNSPVGQKCAEGDGRTPEGEYFVCTRNEQSKFHLALGLSYPSVPDAERAFAETRIDRAQFNVIMEAHLGGKRPPWDTPLGGFIMIHGGGNERITAGCIGMNDADIELLFEACPIGTVVHIYR